MKNANHNYLLTGCTGILGSHILYELMLAIHNNNYEGKLVLLLRSRKDISYTERFNELFNGEAIPDYLKTIDMARIRKNNITLVDFDLRYGGEIDFTAKLEGLKYHLIHCAASVNLGTNAYAFDEIKHNNYLGTLNLIHTLHSHLLKVSYVSTAFSLSNQNGKVYESNTDRNDGNYRNYYEQYKVQTELEVAQICDVYALPLQIFRPSIICGRLVDYPHHVIPRFLVFYLFGAFFYRAKAAYGDQHIRIAMNLSSGLNLIPVDYASKAIVRALHTDIKELNIVSKKSVPNTYTIPEMLRLIGWNNYEFMETLPESQNAVEKLYYRTVGAQLNNYLSTPETSDTRFNVNTLSELMKDIEEPDVDAHFTDLCTYAVERGFNNLLA
jgi:nucleoside-diphosphate-sugar epimerase